MEQPTEAVRKIFAHHCLRSRINAKLGQLAVHPELRDARPCTEQTMLIHHMRFERSQNRAGRCLDQREVFCRAADNLHAADLARAELFGIALTGRQTAALHGIKSEPAAHLDLVYLFQPAITEHRLCYPLIGKILNQMRDKGVCRIGRDDRAFRMQRLQIIDERRRVIVKCPIGIFHHGNDGGLDLAQRIARICAMHPKMRDAPIAHKRAHLHRIGRSECAVDRVHGSRSFRHGGQLSVICYIDIINANILRPNLV